MIESCKNGIKNVIGCVMVPFSQNAFYRITMSVAKTLKEISDKLYGNFDTVNTYTDFLVICKNRF